MAASTPIEEDPLDAFKKAMQEVPLLTSLDTFPKNIEDNPGLMAIQSLLYEGTPDEVAENFKNQGNELFRQGKIHYKDAMEFYKKGLATKCNDTLRATLLNNQAAIHLENQNYRMSNEDCKEAIKLDPINVKAYYRLTKGLHLLEKYEEALGYCRQGLQIELTNMALLGEQDKLMKKIEEKKKIEEEKREKGRKEKESKKIIDNAIGSRGIKLEKKTDSDTSSSAFTTSSIDSHHRVYLDLQTNQLHWPVFIVYPEYKQTDFIADFNEDDRIIDHLATIFEGSPPWDDEKKYTNVGKLGVYFEARTKDGKLALAKVNSELTLKKILSHQSYTVFDRTPGLIVMVKGSPFEKQFIDRYKSK